MKHKTLYGIMIVLILMIITFKTEGKESMRKKLETVCHELQGIGEKGNEQQFSHLVSRYRISEIKKNLDSMGKSLTDEYRQHFAASADFSDGSFIKTIERGPTIGLVYKIKSNRNKTSTDTKTYLFFKFVCEKGQWKFDGKASIQKKMNPSKGMVMEFEDGDIPKDLAIDGIVRIPLKENKKAEIAAVLDIFSMGYSISATVNDAEAIDAKGGMTSTHIKNGLKHGENSIILVIKKIEGKSHTLAPEVTIKYIGKDSLEKIAFSWLGKGNPVGTFNKTFAID